MTLGKVFRIAGFVCLLTVATLARAAERYPPLPQPLELQQVPGQQIYYVVGHGGIPGARNEGFTSNAGFVVTPAGVVVFDALGTPSLGWALLQEIRKVTTQPVRYIVASHYHADHIYGLQAFKDHTDGIVIAEDKAMDYVQGLDKSERLDQRQQVLAPWVNDKTRVVPPDILFKDRMTLRLGGQQFQLIFAGPAHSASDSMMTVEPSAVLFAGDIVQNGRVPFMNADDVDTENWLKGMAEVESLHPSFIIPGHGKAFTDAAQAISFTRDYIQYVRAQMKQAVAKWMDFEAAYKATDWSRYANLPAFKANNRGNAYRIYLEEERKALQ